MTLNRRQFVKKASTAAAVAFDSDVVGRVSILVDPDDPVAASAPVQWAIGELTRSLSRHRINVSRVQTFAHVKPADKCIAVTSKENSPAPAESVALFTQTMSRREITFACAHDARGLVYALLELADRVQNSPDPLASLTIRTPILESPANAVRGIDRLFTSDVEDKPWFNDRQMWPHYLTLLATQRFNRFSLALGIGYDFIRQVTDAYFLFAYPFLLDVPGYQVRANPLPDSERDNNLAMLQFISEQTVARGMEFQLGLWMHGYEWIDSPHPNYTIEGVTKENHAAYCRDAVRLLLQKCPAISGITFRVHGESGVEEGSFDFWKTVFDGVATCGRQIRLDMHSKGMNQSMLDIAVDTKLPVTLSPKFWAEHMGMTYHQADIREQERPKPGQTASALMKFSAGSRSFLRYGYGDLLREDRPWKVVYRIWPGTQRLLLWGDPVFMSAYSKAFSFCGSDGVEICEPLSFKGRRGTGLPGGRCAYADKTLNPRWDWQKYEYTYRVWGRFLYNPDTPAAVTRRSFDSQFGPAAEDLEASLGNASRILPIITTAYGPSAANNNYWPELYLNQSVFDAEHFAPYSDTDPPKVFGHASPFDPQLFSRMDKFADQLLSGKSEAKYSPVEVAEWLENCSRIALERLAKAGLRAQNKQSPEYCRLALDVQIQAGLGQFFAHKFRCGVLYSLFEKTGDRVALDECLKQYRRARAAWARLASQAKDAYVRDITVGEHPQLRGHWLDRLPAIDRDIAGLEAKLSGSKNDSPNHVPALIQQVLGNSPRPLVEARHTPARQFQRGKALPITLQLQKPAGVSVLLHYRHVNQAERYQTVEMTASNGVHSASIPPDYTDSDYPLAYYFEIHNESEALLYPGLPGQLTGTPYFVVRS